MLQTESEQYGRNKEVSEKEVFNEEEERESESD